MSIVYTKVAPEHVCMLMAPDVPPSQSILLFTRTLVLSGTTPPLVNVQCPEFEAVVGVAPKRDRLTSCHAYEVPALTAHSPVSFAV